MASGSKSRRAQEPAKPQAAARTATRAHHRGGGIFGMDEEDSARMLLWGTALAIILLTAFLIFFGYYWTVIKPRGRTVLQVDSTTVSYSEMKRRMAYEYYSQPSLQNTRQVNVVPVLAYQNLLGELILVTKKDELGISYTDEEFDSGMRDKVGVTDAATDEEFGQRYRDVLDQSQLHEDEFRQVVAGELLEQKAKAKILTDAGAAVPQARVEVILVDDRAAADAAIVRINAGEDWATVAKEVSKEPDVQTTGGLKAFQPEGGHPSVYEGYAFSAEIGAVSEPLAETPDAATSRYYIVRVVERSDQPLTEEQTSGYQNREYSELIENTQANMTIVDNWSDDIEAQSSALAPLYRDAQRKEQELANQPTPIVPTIALTPPAAQTPAAGTPPASGNTPPAPATTPVP